MSVENNEIPNSKGEFEEEGRKGLQSSPINLQGEHEQDDEDEYHLGQNTGERLLEENANEEVDDSGMEAGLETDSDEEPTQETAQPGNDLVVLDPDHVGFSIQLFLLTFYFVNFNSF